MREVSQSGDDSIIAVSVDANVLLTSRHLMTVLINCGIEFRGIRLCGAVRVRLRHAIHASSVLIGQINIAGKRHRGTKQCNTSSVRF